MEVKTRRKGKVALHGDTEEKRPIQFIMKQPGNQRERNEDKKDPEQNPSRGIDPESEEEQMEVVDQGSGPAAEGKPEPEKG